MQTDLKLQNEVKLKQKLVLSGDEVHSRFSKVVMEIFSEALDNKVDFNLKKDWNITLSLKTDDMGITSFTGSLKMTDVCVTGSQLSIFETDRHEAYDKVMKIMDSEEYKKFPDSSEKSVFDIETGEEKPNWAKNKFKK